MQVRNELWLGRTGSGKTWGAMDEAMAVDGIVIIFDPKNEPSYNLNNPNRERDWPCLHCYDVRDIDLSIGRKWVCHVDPEKSKKTTPYRPSVRV